MVIVDMLSLICHMISRKHVFKGLCKVWVKASHDQSPPCHICWQLVNEDIKYSLCNVTSQNHVIEGQVTL